MQSINESQDNAVKTYKMAGKSGQFTLKCLVGGVWCLNWDRVTDVENFQLKSFQIQAGDLYDVALLAREINDVVEQAIADEVYAASQGYGSQPWLDDEGQVLKDE